MMLRRGTAGIYVNNVVARWSRAGISLRDQSTLDREAAGLLILKNILVTEIAGALPGRERITVQGNVDAVANAIEFQTAHHGHEPVRAFPWTSRRRGPCSTSHR